MQLPKLVEAADTLPLIRMRNVAGRLHKPVQQEKFVRQEGLPDPQNARQFMETLQNYEIWLGTAHSALAGLITVTGTRDANDIIEGFSAFTDICGMLAPQLRIGSIADLMALHCRLKPVLYFSPVQRDMLVTIRNLRRELRSSYPSQVEIGNCVTNAAIFTLAALSQEGQVAGEAHSLKLFHSYAYFPAIRHTFDQAGFNRSLIKPLGKDGPMVASSAFSFISAAIIFEASLFTKLMNGSTKPVSEIDRQLARPETAELVNPMSAPLYLARSLLLAKKGEIEAADESGEHFKAIQTLDDEHLIFA